MSCFGVKYFWLRLGLNRTFFVGSINKNIWRKQYYGKKQKKTKLSIVLPQKKEYIGLCPTTLFFFANVYFKISKKNQIWEKFKDWKSTQITSEDFIIARTFIDILLSGEDTEVLLGSPLSSFLCSQGSLWSLFTKERERVVTSPPSSTSSVNTVNHFEVRLFSQHGCLRKELIPLLRTLLFLSVGQSFELVHQWLVRHSIKFGWIKASFVNVARGTQM